ncbi:hypothetical protein TNCV_2959841 [Trichonephila clavipes]|nr:hypothetical protein TNCV_2959841 [Trichonephila clavipes]
MRCIGKGAESARMFCGIMNLPHLTHKILKGYDTFYCRQQEEVNTVWREAVREAVDENDGEGTLLLLLMVAGRSVVFFEEWLGDSHKC